MPLKYLMAGLTLCLTFSTLFATNAPITGTIVDEDGRPLEFANATLFTAGDSTLIDGTVTNAGGHFSLSAPATTCFLRISALGYEGRDICNPCGEQDTIQLFPASYALDEIVVNGSRPVVKLKTDGLQVVIAGTYLANAGTALDMLGKMPFVSNTGSELEVFGKGAPIVYVNGRHVRDLSELDLLASSEIKSVDVATSPGARYDSSVNAVIRITTVAPAGEGFSFNDRTTLGYKRYVYTFEQANFNFRKNGFDLFGMLNYENYRERPQFENKTTQYFKSGTVDVASHGKEFCKYPAYEGKAGLNYNSGGKSVGFFYDFVFRPSSGNDLSLSSRLVDGIAHDALESRGNYRRHNRQHSLSAYYAGALGKWQLAANFDALWQINDRSSSETEISSVNAERVFATTNDVNNRLLAGNATATLPLGNGKLRFGTEINNIFRKDLYISDADFIPDNDTKIKETTYAFFAETSHTFRMMSVTAGLRWEYTDSRYYHYGKKIDDQSRQYHNLAPSASISLPIGNVSANLAYTRKTSRPAFEQLSSAVRYLYRYSYESGNPKLKPVYRDYISLSASWRDLVMELTYNSTKNYFMWQTAPYPGSPDAALLRMENMPRYSAFEAFANYAPCFFTIWRPTFIAGISAQNFKLAHNGMQLKLNKPLGILRFGNALQLPWGVWLNIDFQAQTSGDADNAHLKGRWNCDIAFYKSFADDAWTLKLQLNDVFNTNSLQMTSYDALSIASVHKIYDTRDLSLTIRCNFNTSRSRYKGRGAANAEKNRL